MIYECISLVDEAFALVLCHSFQSIRNWSSSYDLANNFISLTLKISITELLTEFFRLYKIPIILFSAMVKIKSFLPSDYAFSIMQCRVNQYEP